MHVLLARVIAREQSKRVTRVQRVCQKGVKWSIIVQNIARLKIGNIARMQLEWGLERDYTESAL